MQIQLAAEGLGTFWLVFGGCGSAVLAAAFPELGIGFVGVSLAFGLTVLTMAYTVGGISGGHFNPAVSVGLMVAGRFPAKHLLPYIAAQVPALFCQPLRSISLLRAKTVSRRAVLPRTAMARILRGAMRSSRPC